MTAQGCSLRVVLPVALCGCLFSRFLSVRLGRSSCLPGGWRAAVALFLAVISACTTAHATCRDQPPRPRVAVDIGHGPKAYGATSARGAREFDFNRRFASELVALAKEDGRVDAFLIVEEVRKLSLRERVFMANGASANAFVSIHHDAAQRQFLTKWVHDGRELLMTKDIGGFSLFVSRENPRFVRSQRIAEQIARQWILAGHKPTLHHAVPVPGESRELLDKSLGVYEAPFAVVRSTLIPAVLIEVGVLVNPDEELKLGEPAFRRKLQLGLIAALGASVCVDDAVSASPVERPSAVPRP